MSPFDWAPITLHRGLSDQVFLIVKKTGDTPEQKTAANFIDFFEAKGD